MPESNANQGAFETILAMTFPIKLPTAGTTVQCRPLPFVLLVTSVSSVINKANEGIKSVKQTQLVDFVKSLVSGSTAIGEVPKVPNAEDATEEVPVSDTKDATDIGMDVGINIVLPLLADLFSQTPELSRTILKQTVVGINDEVIEALSVSDAAEIIATIFENVDKKALTESLGRVFSEATTMFRIMRGGEQTTEVETP